MRIERSEKSISEALNRWAKGQWPLMVRRKLSSLGMKGTIGDPDRLFYWRRKLVLIELKRAGKVSTEVQVRKQEEWRKAGAAVYECDSISKAKYVLLKEFGG